MKRGWYCLGLMSGTSMDAIDAVVARISPEGDQTICHTVSPYDKKLRQILFQKVHAPQISFEDWGVLHYMVGKAFANAAHRCLRQAKQKHKVKMEDVEVIGSHGQTIFHRPEKHVSLQIGMGAVIAQDTGITTVSDFRMADILAGGEGAPLLPYYHRRILGQGRSGIAAHNLGGISNFTYFGPKQTLIALDTGPANCLMDGAAHLLSGGKLDCDQGGRWACQGKISHELLDNLKQETSVAAYIARPAPKSTGRELFSQSLLTQFMKQAQAQQLTKEDILATLTQFSVDLMVDAYQRFVLRRRLPLREVVFCGGGARNPFLLERFQKALPQIKLSRIENYGVDSQVIEAQAFACYGLMTLLGQAQNLPQATGAKQAVVGGIISPGKNWSALYRKVYSISAKRF